MNKAKIVVMILAFLSCMSILHAQYIPTAEKITNELKTYEQENGLNFYRKPTPIIRAYRAISLINEFLGFKSIHHALVFLSSTCLSLRMFMKHGTFIGSAAFPVSWVLADLALDRVEKIMDSAVEGLAREKAAMQLKKTCEAFESTQKFMRGMGSYSS